jgi:hypothetical protein
MSYVGFNELQSPAFHYKGFRASPFSIAIGAIMGRKTLLGFYYALDGNGDFRKFFCDKKHFH